MLWAVIGGGGRGESVVLMHDVLTASPATQRLCRAFEVEGASPEGFSGREHDFIRSRTRHLGGPPERLPAGVDGPSSLGRAVLVGPRLCRSVARIAWVRHRGVCVGLVATNCFLT